MLLECSDPKGQTKIHLIIISLVIWFNFNLFSQNETTQTFESKMKTCFIAAFKNEDDKSLKDYFEECMHQVEFPFFCVEDIDEKLHCSNKFEDSYLINYWFEGCAGCVNEKPFLERLSSELPSLKIVSLCKYGKDSFNDILKKQLDWICVANYENKGLPNCEIGYPLTILVDKNGKVSLAFAGGIQKEATYNKLIEKLKIENGLH